MISTNNSDLSIFLPELQKIRNTLHILHNKQTGQLSLLAFDKNVTSYIDNKNFSLVGTLPPLYPEYLGDQNFLKIHGAQFPYIVGEMANGISTANMVISAAQAGLLAFFGAAGVPLNIIENNIVKIQTQLHPNQMNWGSNLIHSPQEPTLETAIVDLYLRQQVYRVSASAYMSLTPAIVRYACTGLTTDPNGNICRRNHVFAKISRPEIAEKFMQPAPQEILNYLIQTKQLTEEEASLATHIPLAEDITIEADSGGHTDNRPLVALFPLIYQLAEKLTVEYKYHQTIRLGAAGGLGTPASVAAAFSLGAAYVLTGSINQTTIESGLPLENKELLANADITDVMMAPAADMFEFGVKLQVLKRGTLFGTRANKLYDYYTHYASLEDIPAAEKIKLEQQILGNSLTTIWQEVCQFFNERDPKQIERAKKDPKHRMALIFRWYLGLSSHWAITGKTERKIDYQIWCSPAMGAFNRWVANSFLADLSQRSVVQIGLNLLEGAATVIRAQQLRSLGITLPNTAFIYQPKPLN